MSDMQECKLLVIFSHDSPMAVEEQHGLRWTRTFGYVVDAAGRTLLDAVELDFDDMGLTHLPDGRGLWVWEGKCGWSNPHVVDPDFIFQRGAWRRPTSQELWRATRGHRVWPDAEARAV